MAHVLASELRASVLKNAVSGGVSTTLKTDTPINETYKSLSIDKKLDSFEEPFDIPDTWMWIQIGNLGEKADTSSFADGPFGSNLKKEHQTLNKEVRIIQLSNIGDDGWKNENEKYTTFDHLKTIARCEVHPDDFVIAKMMPAGRTIIVPDLGTKITLGSDAVKFVPNKILNKRYLLLAMKSDAFLNQVYAEVHGITRVRTSLNKIKSYALPIPPIEEQARIVARVDELMAEIDEYEKIENQLVELKKNFPGDMKAAVLQAAMQGKLTDIYDYVECEYGDMFEISGGSQPSKNAFIDTPKEGYIQLYQTRDYGEKPQPVYIPIKYATKQTKEGDILLARYGGSLGKVFWAKDGAYNVAMAKVIFNKPELHDPRFVYYYHLSPIYQGFCSSVANGRSAQAGFNKDDIGSLPYPLFTIEEQKRIVEKLDQLLPLCEELEKEAA